MAILLSVCLGVYLLQGACGYPKEYVEFRKLSEEKQHCELRSFPIEKQIDFYLYSMTREPPDPRFAGDIASLGKEVSPVLLDRLRRERADYRKSDLIEIFDTMNAYYVDLRDEQEILGQLDEIISTMTDPFWRRMSERTIKGIREGRRAKGAPPARPPCDQNR